MTEQGCADVKAAVTDVKRSEPYIAIFGRDTIQAFLVVDKHIVDEVHIEDTPFALMAAFFVYDIWYPKGCNNFHTLLEVVALKCSPEKASPSGKYLLAKLSAHYILSSLAFSLLYLVPFPFCMSNIIVIQLQLNCLYCVHTTQKV